MVLLWLLIIAGTLLWALLLFGVWKNRPRRVEIVVWILCIVSLLSSYGMSNMLTEREELIDENFDNINEFIDCFDEWVNDYTEDLVYIAGEEMIDCAIELLDDTTKTYKWYYEE